MTFKEIYVYAFILIQLIFNLLFFIFIIIYFQDFKMVFNYGNPKYKLLIFIYTE